MATGIITTVAGTGTAGYTGDNGLATAAQIKNPQGIAFDSAGNLYIADYNNNRIRKVNMTTGIITTVAGTGVVGYSVDNNSSVNANLYNPQGVSVDKNDCLYFSDTLNDCIRKVDLVVRTVGTNEVNDVISSYRKASVLSDSAGYLLLGSTEEVKGKGKFTASFRIKTSNNNFSQKVCRIEIWENDMKIASRDIKGVEFMTTHDYQLFAVNFDKTSDGGKLEYKLYWNDVTDIYTDRVIISRTESMKVTEYNAQGYTMAITTAAGAVCRYEYLFDASNNVTAIYKKDGFNNLLDTVTDKILIDDLLYEQHLLLKSFGLY